MLVQYLSLTATFLIAVWNIWLQFKIKKIEQTHHERNLILSKTTNFEYETYKELWLLAVTLQNRTKYLRRYPNNGLVSLDIPKIKVDGDKLITYLQTINNLDEKLQSCAPFINPSIEKHFNDIVTTARLEYNQTFAAIRDEIGEKHFLQADANIARIDFSLNRSKELLRRRTLS